MFDSIPVDKSFEGKMLMFSASQYHAVYPFYTSNSNILFGNVSSRGIWRPGITRTVKGKL